MRVAGWVLTIMTTKISTAIIIVILAALGGELAMSSDAAVAPDWQHTTINGDDFQLGQAVSERPVVLFFWASWCPYCKALMPHLQSIRLEYGDKVEIVAVQFKDKKDAAEFMTAAGYDFTVIGDAGEIAELNEIFTTPGLLVVSGGREILFDLRDLPTLPEAKSRKGHSARAAYLAPYWAANLRQGIDAALR